ncbi:carboxymuconolactone decarboxylase family protein [Brevibacillus ginsengisoli]|uniref:carboxymuconolactone decarboxylase family protein n=1 Tax=Brevibacillus ginsengisoli TaxID=363854 RepID=UPI003CF7E919
MNPTTFELGKDFLYEYYEEGIRGVLNGLSEVAPHVGRYIIEGFGHVFSNPTLSYQQRELITLSVLTSLGDCPNQLNWHIHFGLKVGLTPEEIMEIFTHCIPFSGFPRSLNAVGVAKQVFTDLQLQVKVEDELLNVKGRRERGLAKLIEIDGEHGTEVIQSLANISPDLGNQIVDFTFGEIYSRSALDSKQRQLVTLGSLTAQGGCEPQLQVHVNAAMRVGLSKEEIVEALLHCSLYTGFPKVLNAIRVAREVL